MPRIIAGTAKRTRLNSPRGMETRPTADRVKEALFSILTGEMPVDGFLDLFAGTGQIGLEAASRGSDNVVLVEKDRSAIGVIRENIERTRLGDKVKLKTGDVNTIVKYLSLDDMSFRIIFLDPPYRNAVKEFCRLAPMLRKILAAGGMIVLEHEKADDPPANVMNLQLSRRCQYGTTMLSFYYYHDGEKAVYR